MSQHGYAGLWNPIKPIVGAATKVGHAVEDATDWALKHGPIQDPKQTQMPKAPQKRK